MTFRDTIEKVLADLHKPYDTSLGVPPNPDWNRVYDWYEKRYLNPDSPEKGHEGPSQI